MVMGEEEIVLDLLGLKCPMPALLLERALKGAKPGDVFLAEATDPMAEVDLPFAAGRSGAAVLSVAVDGGVVRVRVQKSGGA
jgi:tRNA 2-thiouridine synthesizing protein A